jgi:hypothetical protein
VKAASRENRAGGMPTRAQLMLPGVRQKREIQVATGRGARPDAIEFDPDRGIAQLARGLLEDFGDMHECLARLDLGGRTGLRTFGRRSGLPWAAGGLSGVFP